MKTNLLILIQELLWWILTVALSTAILFPILSVLKFNLLFVNLIFLITFITYFRYSIMYSRIRFLNISYVKYILFTLNFLLVVYIIYQLEFILNIRDNFNFKDYGTLKKDIPLQEAADLFTYISKELSFFGIASILTILAFQFRIIISYWKNSSKRLLNTQIES